VATTLNAIMIASTKAVFPLIADFLHRADAARAGIYQALLHRLGSTRSGDRYDKPAH
jgi:hypothetical protein